MTRWTLSGQSRAESRNGEALSQDRKRALTCTSRRGDLNPEPSVYKTPSGFDTVSYGFPLVDLPAGSLDAGPLGVTGFYGRVDNSWTRSGPVYLHYDDPEPPPLSEWQTLRRRVVDALVFCGTLAALILAWDWL